MKAQKSGNSQLIGVAHKIPTNAVPHDRMPLFQGAKPCGWAGKQSLQENSQPANVVRKANKMHTKHVSMWRHAIFPKISTNNSADAGNTIPEKKIFGEW